MVNDQSEQSDRTFDDLLLSAPPTSVPQGLRDRCLATVPSPVVRRPEHAIRHRAMLLWTFASATAIAFGLVGAGLVWPTNSELFATAIENVRDAKALHMVIVCRNEEDKGVEKVDEWWCVRGEAWRRTIKRNDTIETEMLKKSGNWIVWRVSNNTVDIEPYTELIELPSFTDPAVFTLPQLEALARKQNVPVSVTTLNVGNKRIRRYTIKDVQQIENGDATLLTSAIVDIDPIYNRIVRVESQQHATGIGQDRFALPKASFVFTMDYPDPRDIPETVFQLNYPSDATVVTHAAPKSIRDDEDRLRALAVIISQYLNSHGNRLPQNWQTDLCEVEELNRWHLVTHDDESRPDSQRKGFTSWTFPHSGKIVSDFENSDTVVIAEHRYDNGYRLVLYVSGRTEVTLPSSRL